MLRHGLRATAQTPNWISLLRVVFLAALFANLALKNYLNKCFLVWGSAWPSFIHRGLSQVCRILWENQEPLLVFELLLPLHAQCLRIGNVFRVGQAHWGDLGSPGIPGTVSGHQVCAQGKWNWCPHADEHFLILNKKCLFGCIGTWLLRGRAVLRHVGSFIAARGLLLSRWVCPAACGIFVPQPWITPAPPTLQGGF